MKALQIDDQFESWQEAARQALANGDAPDDIVWKRRGAEAELSLFADSESSHGASGSRSVMNEPKPSSQPSFRVPAAFIELARTVALHSDPAKWPLLYRVLWRLTHGEPRLLEIPTDVDFIALGQLAREVQRDAYRMRQYIRFRETSLDGEPWFVAWYEPDHDSVQLNDQFFRDRFANHRWSILTPKRCMHWDGAEIRLTEGVQKSDAPVGDDVEPLWVTYYSNVFNPARVKVKAMKAQMPVRIWKNLPEAAAIAPLLARAPLRVERMMDVSERRTLRDSEYSLAQPPETTDWASLRDAAVHCRACPLWKNATCTVFGEGPQDARIVLVGEQPGDSEDRAGRPFVGPAGEVLDRALASAGVDRSKLYVTNAVKHFKWEPRGKRRLHQTPNGRDVAACRPWLEQELRILKPQLIVAMGRTALRSLFDADMRVGEERGKVLNSRFGNTLVTVHPSALLRLPPGRPFEPEFGRFVDDLRQITSVVE